MQVMQCVREVRRNSVSGAEIGDVGGTGTPYRYPDDEALRVKNWLPGSYSRLKRSMESAISHPTGRGIPVLWRMYMSLEVCIYNIYLICSTLNTPQGVARLTLIEGTRQMDKTNAHTQMRAAYSRASASTCYVLESDSHLSNMMFLVHSRSGHAGESHTSETIVLARDSRVSRQQIRLDGRSSRQRTRPNRCGRA